MMILDDLESIIRDATQKAFEEKISPHINENKEEIDRQKKTAKETADLEANKKAKDLEEAEDDEEKTDDDVSAKAALGKDQEEESGDTPSAVMPTSDDMAEANVDQIINMLNMLRSGKSTKDETVKKELGEYFDGLQPGDRQALFILLSGLTQIMTSGVDGAEAPAPAKVGVKIRAKNKEKDSENAEDKIRKTAKANAAGKDSEVAAPIVVGESQNKAWIYKILERNKS